MNIRTPFYTMTLSEKDGSLSALYGGSSDLNLLSESNENAPMFIIHYLDQHQQFQQITSAQAASCAISSVDGPEETSIHLSYTRLSGFALDAHVTIRCHHQESLSYWSLSLTQDEPLLITHIQFPFVVVPYHYQGHGSTHLLLPKRAGHLYYQPEPEQFPQNHPGLWHFTEDPYNNTHYPGATFAQFLAYYHESLGLYVGIHDAHGGVKIIEPAQYQDALYLGLAHAVGWNHLGEHQLGYEIALGVFRGDWYDAADIYRKWYEKHIPAGARLQERKDVPLWLLESPLHVVLRIQGQVDDGPTTPNAEFVPYENAIPYLKHLAEVVDAPLVPILMGWERPGPWIYPDTFPVVGGDESLQHFIALAHQHDWHIGTYCNGTRWATEHFLAGYDGLAYYREHGGENTVCRLPDGEPWSGEWDKEWRPSYLCCAAVPQTRKIASNFVEHLLDLGFDWIQFLDQNCGAATFPCYSRDHGHVAAPASWMSEAMTALLADLERHVAASGREIAFSVEQPPNDYLLPHFQVYDLRPNSEDRLCVPLYQYLYHEYVLAQAAFAEAPNPYWMQIKTAHSFVLGHLITAIMGPEGRLMAWSGTPWATWDTPAGDQVGILALLHRAVALRRGAARDFLVFGRLRRPCDVKEISLVHWDAESQTHTMPAIMYECWQTADGRHALALANWTTEERSFALDAAQLTSLPLSFTVQSDLLTTKMHDASEKLVLTLPPLSVGLLEYQKR